MVCAENYGSGSAPHADGPGQRRSYGLLMQKRLTPMAVIETRALSKRYGSHRGIEDISLQVERAEVFGFLGPNGAGKTTMIRTLLDLLHPTGGQALIFGLDAHRDSLEIRSRLGNLPGSYATDAHLTGRQILNLLAGVRGLEDLGRAEELAQRFRADLDRPLAHLSRGNRQKIGLIQALFHRPELLLLDEPTTGLDPLMQEEFMRLVAEERERGVTVFVSSHELNEVERICSRVAIIGDGRLIAVEAVADLLGRASRNVTLQFDGPAATDELSKLDGVHDLEERDGRVAFKLTGDVNPMLTVAARHRLRDFQVTRPSLEEVFLTYYSQDAA